MIINELTDKIKYEYTIIIDKLNNKVEIDDLNTEISLELRNNFKGESYEKLIKNVHNHMGMAA